MTLTLLSAAKWFIVATEMGDVNGMASLANMYLKGLGMPANVSMALKLFQKVRDALAQV